MSKAILNLLLPPKVKTSKRRTQKPAHAPGHVPQSNRLTLSESELPSTSMSSGNRRTLRPGGGAVIRIEVQEPRPDLPWAALTQRQFEVLELLVEGKPTKQICRLLKMSEGTAKVHISAILKALNVRSRAEAVLAALRAGWIQTSPRLP